jgi:hypothetical protein
MKGRCRKYKCYQFPFSEGLCIRHWAEANQDKVKIIKPIKKSKP